MDFSSLQDVSEVAMVGATAVTGLATKFVIEKVNEYNSIKTLSAETKRFAEGRRQERLKTREWLEKHTDQKTHIDLGDFNAVRAALNKGDISAQTLAEQAQLACLRDSHNAVCEVLALATDKEDDKSSSHSDDEYSVKGMPFTIKECIQYKGYHSTIGDARRIGQTMPESALIVQALEAAGAVPVVTTNIPQTMLTFECSNPIYGESMNPEAPGRTPGGSSGGEAVLHAARCVPFGIGSDIGGSLRIPAHCCGTAALKPSAGRFSRVGLTAGIKGQSGLTSTPGPMAPTVDGVIACFKAVVDASPETVKKDPYTTPKPFNHDLFFSERKLAIGVLKTNNFLEVAPACLRAVDIAAQALEDQGHTIIQFDEADIQEMVDLFYQLVTADGGETVIEALWGQAIDSRIAALVNLVKLPQFVHTLAGYLPQNRVTRIVAATGKKDVKTLWKLQNKRDELVTKFMNKWNEAHLDVLLTPASCMPAPKQGTCSDITPGCWPTFVFNLLDLPAGVMPATRVTVEDDKALKQRTIQDRYDRLIVESCSDAERTPIGVQIVAPRHQDELVLRVMKMLDGHLQYTK